MSDDKTKIGSPDNIRIDINDPDEVRNWTKSLKCTETELIAAVKAVGTYASKVKEYLSKNKSQRLVERAKKISAEK